MCNCYYFGADKMKTYAIYGKEESELSYKYYYLEEGFSSKAMIFNVLWFLYHKLWFASIAFIFFASLILELGATNIIKPFGILLSIIILLITLGFTAKDLLRKKLLNYGYQLVEIIIADSLDQAEYKFISKLTKAHKNK